jgi:preprotein translocase subunit SecY
VAAPKSNNPLAQFGKMTELRQRLLFVIGALIVYRLGSFIPVPGVNPEAMTRMIEQGGGLLNMFNMFSGGALARYSVFALGVMPYISASIVVQMMGSVLPAWQQLKKEGQAGQRLMTKYTRWGTVGLSAVQAFMIAAGMQKMSSGLQVVYDPGFGFLFASVIGLTAGSMFLMWLGEQMTERGIGNGISLIIFAGIVAGLPQALTQTTTMLSTGQLTMIKGLVVVVVVVAVTVFCVFMESAQRRITVNYARRQGGSKAYMNQSSHLPLKINMSGVIPPIFASTLILFPATASSWFSNASQIHWLQRLTTALSPGEPPYMILYAGMIIIFAFFYTAIVFNSQETADNLKRSGALIPGMRPGKATAQYIDSVLTRLTAAGAIYLAAVCLIPTFMQTEWNVPFYFGGTSLLIVVVVAMDFRAQISAHMVSHQYESLLKKANLKRS